MKSATIGYQPFSPYGMFGQQFCDDCGVELNGDNIHPVSDVDTAWCIPCMQRRIACESFVEMFVAIAQVAALPAFFQALASYAASSKRGKKALAEVESMLSDHRIVRVTLQTGHAFCVARVDMPDYGIITGEMFQLFESGYSDETGATYAYIVADGCSCKSYEFRHQCDHRSEASQYNLARYEAQIWHKEDEPHAEAESIEAGDFEVIELPIVLLDADGENALVLRYGSEFTMRVDELAELGAYEQVYSLADFEEYKAEHRLTQFADEAFAILAQEAERERKEAAPLQPSGHIVEEFDGRALLMRAS